MSYLCDNDQVHGPHEIATPISATEGEVVRCYGVQELTVDPQPEGQAPVVGYTAQSPEAVALVNQIKGYENAIGDLLAKVADDPVITNPRMVSIARTNLQQGFMWLVRSVFQPESRL